MTFSVSFSGGVGHKNEVPADKQRDLAQKVSHLLQGALGANGISGTGTVFVGTESTGLAATSLFQVD